MKLLALDLSTKTGWAVFEDGKPTVWGTLFPDKTVKDFGEYPFNYPLCAEYLIQRLFDEVIFVHAQIGTTIVIEETNASRQNYSQKLLEFLHYALCRKFAAMGKFEVRYIRTGEWRKKVNGNLSKEEKLLNGKISRIKKKTGKKLAKIDGKVVGKKTRKHSALRVCLDEFQIELKKKDEDAADALCLGLGYLRGAPACDGTIKGGITKKAI